MPSAGAAAGLTFSEQRYQRVRQELLDSEAAYLNYMRCTTEYFEVPLRINELLPPEVHSSIFANIQQLISVNRELMNHLQHMEVGHAFLEVAPYLKLYSHYARTHVRTLNVLEEWRSRSPELANFLRNQEAKPQVCLTLPALLIMPIQRVPRYELLLHELLRSLRPQSACLHSDGRAERRVALERALQEITAVARHINEALQVEEEGRKLLCVQKSLMGRYVPQLLVPGRRLLRQDTLKKISVRGGEVQERVFFLFSDLLMYVKSVSTTISSTAHAEGNMWQCCALLPLHHCFLERVFGGQTSGALMLAITCKSMNVMLFFDKRDFADVWIDAVETAVRRVQASRVSLRKESSKQLPIRTAPWFRKQSMCYTEKWTRRRRTLQDDVAADDINNKTIGTTSQFEIERLEAATITPRKLLRLRNSVRCWSPRSRRDYHPYFSSPPAVKATSTKEHEDQVKCLMPDINLPNFDDPVDLETFHLSLIPREQEEMDQLQAIVTPKLVTDHRHCILL